MGPDSALTTLAVAGIALFAVAIVLVAVGAAAAEAEAAVDALARDGA